MKFIRINVSGPPPQGRASAVLLKGKVIELRKVQDDGNCTLQCKADPSAGTDGK